MKELKIGDKVTIGKIIYEEDNDMEEAALDEYLGHKGEIVYIHVRGNQSYRYEISGIYEFVFMREELSLRKRQMENK